MRLFQAILIFAIAMAIAPTSATAQPKLDNNRYQLVFVGNVDAVAPWFEDHDGLADLKRRCAVLDFQPTDTLFRVRYAGDMPAGSRPPAIVFARPDSGVLYCATRDTMPASAEQLFREIRDSYKMAQERPSHADTSPRFSDDRRSGLRRDSSRLSGSGVVDTVAKLPSIRSPLNRLNETMQVIKYFLAALVAVMVALLVVTFLNRHD